ncbi:MAG: aspartate--tRNA ligase [Candidatus Aminicenantia bacterium]
MAQQIKLDSIGEWRRTHYGGSLKKENIGNKVTLFGWVRKKRDLGKIIFIDFADRDGIVQCVFTEDKSEAFEKAKLLKSEYVVAVRGRVRERIEKNPSLKTGEIEVEVEEIKILNVSDVPPFSIEDEVKASEELRLKYRYLDLRRTPLQKNIKLRHLASIQTRIYLHNKGFLEIETPFLTRSTPEGARDYIVPSRIYPGKFYALPQSPQLFKQLLMISGFDKYFQIVRCFRDEDLRADRQPEFTQIDIEMSFPDEEQIFELIEGLMVELMGLIGKEIETPFNRLNYEDAMEFYGTDKPDLRITLKIRDFSDKFRKCGIEFIEKGLGNQYLKGILTEKSLSRKEIDELGEISRKLGGKGIIWIRKEGEFRASPRFPEEFLKKFWDEIEAGDGWTFISVLDEKKRAQEIMGEIRKIIGKDEFEKNKDKMEFIWITDFPLFIWSEEEGRLVSNHHPFTSPKEEDISLLDKDPAYVKARAYDLVLNGYEIGGGSIRIHDSSLQQKIFNILGLSEKEAKEKFGFLLDALRFGAPPHGGIALGFDRIVMIMAGENSLREVIPFPKTASAMCLMTNSPSEVLEKQLKELNIFVDKKKRA